MTRTILKPVERSTEEQSYPARTQLPIAFPCQVYPRVSTAKQKKNVSAEMQADKQFALSCGWREDMVILDTRDLGLSGQLKMEDRPTFNEMNRRAANGEIKAVVVTQVDRLFRDRWGVEYSKFMEMCAAHGVVVVTPEFVFDFSVAWHVERFRRKCEEAYNYISQHIEGRMLPARDHLAGLGYWTGGNIPVGFTIDPKQRHKKYLVYPPHAEIVKEVFALFQACGGVLSDTYRRLQGCLFPPFDATVEGGIANKLNLSKVLDAEGKLLGYQFASLSGLASMLSNPAYIGSGLFRGRLIPDNHPAIVTIDVFLYAYNLLARTTLQGTSNPNKKSYTTTRPEISRTLLAKVMVSGDDPAYRIYPERYPSTVKSSQGALIHTYKVCCSSGSGGTNRVASYRADEIDSVVISKLVECLQNTDVFTNYQSEDTSESEHLKQQERIERDLTSVRAAMKRNVLILSSGTITELDLLQGLNTTQQKLAAEAERLEQAKIQAEVRGSKSSRRMHYCDLVNKLGEHWTKLDAAVILDMVDVFIDRVILSTVSPCLYTLDVVWADPCWEGSQALCVRNGQKSAVWKKEEDAVLRELYPTAPIEQVMQALDSRTLNTIRDHASQMGIARRVRGERAVAYTLTYRDVQQIEKWGMSLERFVHLREKRNGPDSLDSGNLVSWSRPLIQFSRIRPFDLERSIARLESILAN